MSLSLAAIGLLWGNKELLMAIVHLQPGGVMNVAANRFPGNVQVRRPNNDHARDGAVGFKPANGALIRRQLVARGSCTLPINGLAGQIINYCECSVDVG
jgi:hypothetical protein